MGIVGAAVYYSMAWGVWDASTDNGRRLWQRVRQRVLPGTIVLSETVSFCCAYHNNSMAASERVHGAHGGDRRVELRRDVDGERRALHAAEGGTRHSRQNHQGVKGVRTRFL